MMTMLLALAATAQPADDRRVIYSDDPQTRALQQRIGWADAVIAGDTVYVSGIIATTRPGDKDLRDAYVRAFDQLGQVLERAGAKWSDVVEVRSFHTDPNAQLEAMAEVKHRYIPAPDPAWTAVGTSALLSPTGITEIALTARIAKDKK